MGGLEVAVIGLGTAVAKTACGVWLGDHKFAAGVSGALLDFAAGRLVSTRERRQFQRLWDQTAELVAGSIRDLGS